MVRIDHLGLDNDNVLAAVIELSPVGIGVIATDGTLLLSSTYPELVGRNLFEVFAAHVTTADNLRATLRGTETRWSDERNGVTYDARARPIRDASGLVTGALLISTIVTERVEAQRRLLDSEARVRHIVDSNMLAIMFWQEDGAVFEANDAFLALFGYEREDITARRVRWADLEVTGFEEADAAAHAAITETGTCPPYEKTLRHRSGAEIPVLVGGTRFDRHRSAGIAFMLDRSEAKRREQERDELQAQLLHVQKLESLGVLAGGIAHDFNNLLTAILGGAATAMLSLPSESPARADIDIVLGAARRAADLTRQLLAYSGKGHFQVKPLDLSAAAKELALLLETTIPKKVQLKLELAAGLPAIPADATQVQQIIMNLVINGAEAIGADTGTVLVTTGQQHIDAEYAGEIFAAEKLEPGRYVFLEVHDTGSGMDDETRAKIFDPFFTTKFTGRGLGLAAVLGIVRTHRGAIRVYSTPGRGTTFKVLFPATDAVAAAPSQPRAAYHGSGVVLVVDDDDAVRRSISRMLSYFGFSVVQACDGREAIEIFRDRPDEFALVFLDMTMPVMDGEETLRELRALRPGVPVLLTSGYNEIEATRRFTAKGLTAFLQKPFVPADLAAKLETILPSSPPK